MIPRRLCFILCLAIFSLEALKSASCHRTFFSEDDEREFNEFKEFLEWKKMKNEHEKRGSVNIKIDYLVRHEDPKHRINLANNKSADKLHRSFYPRTHAGSIDPPPVDQPAMMGRFIVNQADWAAVGTISSRKDIFSFPNANVISVSDGPLGNGSGIPYMYLTTLDFTAQDLALDNRATLLMSLAQGSYCGSKNLDPMDPRCARIILAGRILEVTNATSEYEIAKNAVFVRHPWLAHMPTDHNFFFAKLDIASIAVLDTFGGPQYVSIKDYFNPTSKGNRPKSHQSPKSFSNENSSFESSDRKTVFMV